MSGRGSSKLVSPRMQTFALRRSSAGQALIETILLVPLMLLIVLNVINFGYFFVVAVNLAASPRSGVEYSMLGFATPGAFSLPAAGAVSYLAQQDLTGAINAPTGANIQVCSSTIGVSGTGSTQTTKCKTCTGAPTGTSLTCGATGTGSPAPSSDPEAPNFMLDRVDVDYTFSPLIPGTPFGLALLPISTCSSNAGTVTCVFHRQVSMREMN